MTTFDNIKKYANLRGLNLRDTATKAGLSPNAIYRYNQGVEPKYPTLKAIADALAVDVSDLSDEYAPQSETEKAPTQTTTEPKHIDVDDIVNSVAPLTQRDHALSDEDQAAIRALVKTYLESKEGQDRLRKYGDYDNDGKKTDGK
ncbi:helix-turn-helix transcriptional regulator [Lactiplantibacillus pentosus]|uniref:helix-turn-helix domain-containing protein n=1 Tax=Lactiplantibacillus pentosus TaxID=1589 RepID=UPI00132FCA34|nr:helix-turn-helix transcriptional regulator [Lactiplantibacillus pentosus]MBQ0837544.1 helix-turn-helix transcriptional regulator [Lactiplantibacillus pentosus]